MKSTILLYICIILNTNQCWSNLQFNKENVDYVSNSGCQIPQRGNHGFHRLWCLRVRKFQPCYRVHDLSNSNNKVLLDWTKIDFTLNDL